MLKGKAMGICLIAELKKINKMSYSQEPESCSRKK